MAPDEDFELYFAQVVNALERCRRLVHAPSGYDVGRLRFLCGHSGEFFYSAFP